MADWRHSTHRLRLLVLGLVGVCLLLPAGAQRAAAHPLGNFTINLYSRLDVGVEQVVLHYILDMAEIPTYQEFGGTLPSATEQSAYLERKAPELMQGLRLRVDGTPHQLAITGQHMEFPAGQGGLATTRIELDLVATLPGKPADSGRAIDYEDTNYAGRLGWHEIVVRPAPGARLVATDVADQDRSNELRTYPGDMLSSPLDVRKAQLQVAVGAGTRSPVATSAGASATRATDRFAALISAEQLTLPVRLLAVVLALGLGAVHALSPGHGKTIVGAYLVGARGTARHALFLGLTVTITHTLGVFALGLITLYASAYILPDRLYPWLGVISGALVVLMGATLFSRRLQAVRGHSDHGHEHPHIHDHAHEHHPHAHSHGGQTHSHLPPGGDGAPLTWRNLLALGISGGLIPCPSALLVMLSAISLQRVGFGLVLILAFSVGLAGVLTGIGLLFVYGGRWLTRLGRRGIPTRMLRLVPVASALVVTTAGIVITAQAMLATGLVR